MQCSITFEMNVRLLTGLKLGKINSNPSFLRSGLTTAVFHSLQNSPSPRDKFTILVISVITFGSIFFNTTVGMASSLQDLDLREAITLLTWVSVRGANLLSSGTSIGAGLYLGLSLSKSLIFFYFTLKVGCEALCQFIITCMFRSFLFGVLLVVRLFTRACSFLESLVQSWILHCSTAFFLALSSPK